MDICVSVQFSKGQGQMAVVRDEHCLIVYFVNILLCCAAPYQPTGPTPTLYSLITHFTSLFFHIVTFSVDALTTNI
jgi:hypothetical protein